MRVLILLLMPLISFAQATNTVTFNVFAGDYVNADYDNVVVNGSWNSWQGWGVVLEPYENNDGWYTGQLVVDYNTSFEYLPVLTGSGDSWSGWGVLGVVPEICHALNPITGQISPNYFINNITSDVDLYITFNECPMIQGCTNTNATNYNPNADIDDGSCNATIISSMNISCENGNNSHILQVFNSLEQLTNGGQSTNLLRTIYAYSNDTNHTPSYIGGTWAYVYVSDSLIISPGINAIISTNQEGVLLINGSPAYQFSGDYNPNDAFGNFGSWNYFYVTGEQTQDPCSIEGCNDPNSCNFEWYAANNENCIYPYYGVGCDGVCLNEDATEISFYTHDYGITIENCEGDIIFESSDNFLMDNLNSVCIENLPNAYNIFLDSTLVSVENSESITDFGWQNGKHKYTVNTCSIYGCINQDALNFNPLADTDDGSCIMPIYGCNDTNAVNYNPIANVNMACIYTGCTDPSANNYNADATVDDGSCDYGSVSTTFNVDMNCAGVVFSTVHITGPVWGWTADIVMSDDDGDGIYSITFVDLSGDVEYKYMVDYFADQENLVDDMVDGGDCAPITDYLGYYANRQVAAGSTTSDTYGSCSGCSDDISGCTDASANNYNANATSDDGSCINAVYGCTDEDADNYYSEANVDNGQCQYFGCIDPTACNYDASKNADDGTCYYLSLELSSIDNSCSGGSLGQITSNVNGGFGNLSYTWNTGETSEDLFNLSAGNYDLTVSDQNGCTVSESTTISEPSIDAELFSPEICYITVDDNTGFNKIVVNPINHESVGGYVIYKEVLTDSYYPIATLDANSLEYVDSTSNPLINSDRYKVNVIDNCLFESEQSDAHRTVHLSMNAGLNNSVNLIWNKYDGFDVSSYMVFRGQSVSNMEFVGFIAGSQNSYTDLNPPVGTSIYQVRVVAPICNSASSNPNASFAQVADTLKSNIVEHDYEEQNDDLGVNIIANNPSCASCTDGSVIAFAYGGSAPYNYVWSNGVTTSFNFNVGIGTYTIYVSDNQGNIVSGTITLTAESSEVLGCTDTEAINFNAAATEDDGSCEYPVVDNPCDITPSGLFVDNIIHERVAFNWSAPSSAPSYYMIRYRPVGTNGWTVMSAGPQNDVPFTGTSRTRYFMEPGTTYQWNIRARVVDENGATVCQSPWSASHQYTTLPACANLTDLSVNPEANLVYFNASKPSGDWGVWQAKGKIREVGSNNYRYLATTVDSYTNQIKYNFTPSTDYEWHTKAWCTGNVDEDGNSDPQYHSGWAEFSAFTTQEPCDKLPTNLSTSSGNNANTAITMSWDTPTSGQPHHYFLELTNETTGQVFSWNNLAGSSTSKTKYGQSSGDQFKWRIRGACGENGTSWATPFTGYEYYTLGGDRLGDDIQSNSQLTNISVYPNPSRGEFNISFDLESRQDVYLSITNYLGKVVFTEELKEQEGQYNQTIDLGNKANGIYMLNITTNNQNINQRIVIQ